MSYALDGHVTRTDRSSDTGTLVVCTCGATLGPMMNHDTALSVAREHRGMHRVHGQRPADP
ncbi:hypothetical protein [Microbacterium sp. As-52]|uniref:hypothetical protein n=1 Tax=Microbacterium sp. As-52 TaxID=3390503 RepID=UPI003CE9BBC7